MLKPELAPTTASIYRAGLLVQRETGALIGGFGPEDGRRIEPESKQPLDGQIGLAARAIGEGIETRAPGALPRPGKAQAFQLVDDRGGLWCGVNAALRRAKAAPTRD